MGKAIHQPKKDVEETEVDPISKLHTRKKLIKRPIVRPLD